MVQVGRRGPTRRLFTVEEYHRMAAAEILKPTQRVELIRGTVVDMPFEGGRDGMAIANLVHVFGSLVDECQVRVRDPIRLSERTEVRPDVTLLIRTLNIYARSSPMPRDVLLFVEVADDSAGLDRKLKVPLYAHYRIPEVWLVDIQGGTLETFLSPAGGRYALRRTFRREQRLSPATFPDLEIAVDTVLG